MTVAEVSVLQAAETLGLTPYELGRHLRQEAASQLLSLASDIERGAESNQGDVDADEFADRTQKVWNLVTAAQTADAVWLSE